MDEITRKRIASEIDYGELTPDDLPALSRLIDGMRREGDVTLRIRDYSPQYYDWVYFRNPAGPAVVFAGKHKGRLVTSFAITPKWIQFGADVVLCGKTMDMFTDPEYQGLGLIREVTSRVFDEARRRGIGMWYVTPSVNSYPIFKDKWRYVESVRVNYVVRILDYSETLAASLKPRGVGRLAGSMLDLGTRLPRWGGAPGQRLEAREEPSFGPETDELWSRSHGYGVALARDAAYLTWRYVDNPDHYDIVKFFEGGSLHGILVTKHTRRRGIKVGELVDVVTPPTDVETRRAMLRFALRGFAAQGCAFAQAWAIEGSAWERELRAVGIGRRRRPMTILQSPGAPREEFYDPHEWFLTQGDGNDV